jgi:hypothetical protein
LIGFRRSVFLITIFFSLSAQLFASGRHEDTPVKTQHDEWVLCVTNFDVQIYAEDKLSVAGVITQKIVERLKVINYRTRVSPEYAYYEGHAWVRDRTAAAKSLAAKQEERSRLIFNGEPGWKYRQNLIRLDTEIEKLKNTFNEIENNPPIINNDPVFRLTTGNMASSFPAAPVKGNELKFCTDQRADAFLTGTIRDFHGRFIVLLKLYTVYARSFVYEDSIIFSTDDLENALDEITGKLILVLSGNKPSAITVRAQPEDSLVLINQSFAGRGNTGITEQSPGRYVITASASEHESMTIETELSPGELIEVDFSLKPVEYGNVDIFSVFPGSSVYYGALYVGKTPLTLRLPLNTLESVEVETFDPQTRVLQKGLLVFNTPDTVDTIQSFNIPVSPPQDKGRVERERRIYYWVWGGTWVTGIAAWLVYYTYVGSDLAIRHSYAQTDSYDQKFYDDYQRMYFLSMGMNAVVGAAALYGIYQIWGRYIRTAGQGTANVTKQIK